MIDHIVATGAMSAMPVATMPRIYAGSATGQVDDLKGEVHALRLAHAVGGMASHAETLVRQEAGAVQPDLLADGGLDKVGADAYQGGHRRRGADSQRDLWQRQT